MSVSRKVLRRMKKIMGVIGTSAVLVPCSSQISCAKVNVKFDSSTGTLIFSGDGKIGTSWRTKCSENAVKSVVIVNGVEEIGERAFAVCESLQEVTISSSVNKIGKEAFSECRNLKTVRFYNSLRDKISLNAINVCYNKAKVYEANAADKKLLCKIPRDLWGNIESTEEGDDVKSTERPVTIMSLVKEFLFKKLTKRQVVEVAIRAFYGCKNLKCLDTDGLTLICDGLPLIDASFYNTPLEHKGKIICKAGLDLIREDKTFDLSFHNMPFGKEKDNECPACHGRSAEYRGRIMRGKYIAKP